MGSRRNRKMGKSIGRKVRGKVEENEREEETRMGKQEKQEYEKKKKRKKAMRK